MRRDMMTDKNTAQEVVDDLLTDPDKDAEAQPRPTPPQTIDAEPTGGLGGDRADER